MKTVATIAFLLLVLPTFYALVNDAVRKLMKKDKMELGKLFRMIAKKCFRSS